MTYKVSWGFIQLGTIRLSVLDTVQIDGETTYHTQLKIDSSPWLFFVNMHSVFENYLLSDTFPRLSVFQEEIDDEEYNSRYAFDYDNNEINVHHEGVENPGVKLDKKIPLTNQLQDGMSLVFYARANCNQVKREQLSVFYAAQEGVLDINFTGSIDTIEVSFSDEEVPVLYLNGEAHFKAIAGFGGEYEGWFILDYPEA